MSRVVVYSTGNCSYCERAKGLLEGLQIPYTEVRLDVDKRHHREFLRVTNGARTVPQVVIDGRYVGGLAELQALHAAGNLASLCRE
jgi:glutaredoxin 3